MGQYGRPSIATAGLLVSHVAANAAETRDILRFAYFNGL